MFTPEEIAEVNRLTLMHAKADVEGLLKRVTDVQRDRFNQTYPNGITINDINAALEMLNNFIKHNEKAK